MRTQLRSAAGALQVQGVAAQQTLVPRGRQPVAPCNVCTERQRLGVVSTTARRLFSFMHKMQQLAATM